MWARKAQPGLAQLPGWVSLGKALLWLSSSDLEQEELILDGLGMKSMGKSVIY